MPFGLPYVDKEFTNDTAGGIICEKDKTSVVRFTSRLFNSCDDLIDGRQSFRI